MSDTKQRPYTSIEQTGIQQVEEQGSPQHDESSSQPTRSSSQHTLVPDDHEPIRHDTQIPAPRLERSHDQTRFIEQIETHPLEAAHQRSEAFQLPSRSFSQDTLVSSGNYRPIKSIARKPVPAQEERKKYLPIQQNDIYPTDGIVYQRSGDSSRPKSGQAIVTPFAAYGLALLTVFFASLGFWIQSRRRPIFFSYDKSKWMSNNPKTTTMLWTSVAALLAWCTLWLHACAVSLMARKLIIRGAKISTIECK